MILNLDPYDQHTDQHMNIEEQELKREQYDQDNISQSFEIENKDIVSTLQKAYTE